MERVLSVEEKIRRAEEIYERRKQGNAKQIATVNVSDKKRDIKLLKKMIIQILICMSIYLIIYVIQNNSYVFSEDFIKKVNEIISYDTNFYEIYENIKNYIVGFTNKENESIPPNESIGGAEENIDDQESKVDIPEINIDDTDQVEEQVQETQISQEEQDIINIKNTTSFIKPVEGIISSKYGQRETEIKTVPKNHTGTDIAANIGTKIISSTDGEVVLVSEEGDYRKAYKNSNRRSKYNICAL